MYVRTRADKAEDDGCSNINDFHRKVATKHILI